MLATGMVLALAPAAKGDFWTGVIVDATAEGCSGTDRQTLNNSGARRRSSANVVASATTCLGNPVHGEAWGVSDLAYMDVRAHAVGDNVAGSGAVEASAHDVVVLKPKHGTQVRILVELDGMMTGDAFGFYSWEVLGPGARWTEPPTFVSGGPIAVSEFQDFNVAPGGAPFEMNMTLYASAHEGEANLGDTMSLWVENADISSSDSGVFGSLTIPRIAGDSTRDGRVDVRDLVEVRRNLGRSPAVWSTGDFNGDNKVGLDDLAIVRREMKSLLPGRSTSSPGVVPEPSGLALLFVAALPLRRRARG